MIGVCLAAAGLIVALPLQAFTLEWTHSIEKIRWEEDYRVAGNRLELTEARIRGTGAGMEPPDGAVLKDGVWHYKPRLAPLERMRLTRSPYTADYRICSKDGCRGMADYLGPAESVSVLDVFPCEAAQPPR